jgi:spore coat polysaccharide biosynthesis protein SpsF
MKVVGIVQARMGSQRTPGKSFARIGGLPTVEIVCRRAQRSARLDEVVLATSTLGEDDVLADHAARIGVPVIRGAATDLVARHHAAALASGASHVVRICADNVFLDWHELDRLVESGVSERRDYVAFRNPDHPARDNDFAGEFITMSALAAAFRDARDAGHREHVGPFFRAHPDRFSLGTLDVADDLRTPVKLDLDEPADLTLLQAIGAEVEDVLTVSAADVVRIAGRLAAQPRRSKVTQS